jgi:hypothetical protein
VEGIVNGLRTNFLVDTGAEVSLICATVPGLEVRESCIAPVSITNQPRGVGIGGGGSWGQALQVLPSALFSGAKCPFLA